MATTSLLDELLLLAYDDEKGRNRAASLETGLAGALLLELAGADRIGLDGKRIVVTDPTPTGDELVDEALTTIADGPARAPRSWLMPLGRHLATRVRDRLVAAGTLREEHGRLLRVFPTTRYPAGDPTPERDARDRLDAAVLTGVTPEPRTAVLAALVGAINLDTTVFPDADRKAVRHRLTELAEGDWYGPAGDASVRAVRDAITAAVLAATTAATTAAVSAATAT